MPSTAPAPISMRRSFLPLLATGTTQSLIPNRGSAVLNPTLSADIVLVAAAHIETSITLNHYNVTTTDWICQ